MRRLIILMLTTAFLLSLFSPIVHAAAWDPKNPPRYPHKPNLSVTSETDEGSWIDPHKSSSKTVFLGWLDRLLIELGIRLLDNSDQPETKPQDEATGYHSENASDTEGNRSTTIR